MRAQLRKEGKGFYTLPYLNGFVVKHFPSDLRMTEIVRIGVIGLAKAHKDAFFAHVAHSCYVSSFGGGFCMHNANVLRVLSPTAESNCGLLQGAVLAIWTSRTYRSSVWRGFKLIITWFKLFSELEIYAEFVMFQEFYSKYITMTNCLRRILHRH